MLHEQVQEHVRSLSDDELVEYIEAGADLYEPEAIAFARREFQQRNPTSDRMAQLEYGAQARMAARNALILEKANRPLGLVGRILAFLGGGAGLSLFIFWLVVEHLHGRGEHLKARQTLTWGAMGQLTFLVGGIVALAILAGRTG